MDEQKEYLEIIHILSMRTHSDADSQIIQNIIENMNTINLNSLLLEINNNNDKYGLHTQICGELTMRKLVNIDS